MEVTKANFEAVLPRVLAAVEACDFVAVDLEMSGLYVSDEHRPRATNTMQERWSHTRDAGMQIGMLQVGVCCFTWKPPAKQTREDESVPGRGWTLQAEPFNFWVFPRHIPGLTKDARLVMQVSSIAFLASCGFDFSKAINQGVSYMDSAAAEEARKGIEVKLAEKLASSHAGPAPASSKQKEKQISLQDFRDAPTRDAMQSALRTAAAFQDHVSGQKPEKGGSDQKKSKNAESEDAASGDSEDPKYARDTDGKPYVILEKCNGFCRRFLYQEIARLFPDLHVGKFSEDNVGNHRSEALRLTYSGSASSAAATERKRITESMEKDRLELEANVGLTRVFECIRDAKKPFIGHNCFLDMSHIFAKFFGTPPERFEDFRANLHEIFPMLADTKHVYQSNEKLSSLVGSMPLGDLYKTTSDAVLNHASVKLGPEFSRYQDASENFHHEAGYDAFMTGVVFGRAWTFLKLPIKPSFASHTEFNEICLPYSEGRFRLDEPIQEADWTRFVRLVNFDPSTRSHHLHKLIKGVLGNMHVRIIWESDTSAAYKAPSLAARDKLLAANAAARAKRQSSSAKPQGAADGDDTLDMADLEILPFCGEADSSKRSREPGTGADDYTFEAKRSRNEEDVPRVASDSTSGCSIA
ncbi:PolyA-specific ribonuclease PARN [Hondaea fermentalgiana]|uniref:PolyA-specific ribonuclease PARN n=1 Tax=Hondaea fermentalgiana TaxID=2315210 RepID=A0A2R5GT03_9STRA|nr:PolyA-specific ribonuclease PARN [Hondaea fermentalgiana]|eukprot:GBG31511.1 PolyA-specific ribonuclease PARN [Hondaea fermentalgiana]